MKQLLKKTTRQRGKGTYIFIILVESLILKV